MATRRELQKLACLRLREAEALFSAGCYDGCAYLCGYVVELALKAAICARLDLDEYPEKRLEGKFKKHDFEDLKLLAGLERAFKIPISSPTGRSRRNGKRYAGTNPKGLMTNPLRTKSLTRSGTTLTEC